MLIIIVYIKTQQVQQKRQEILDKKEWQAVVTADSSCSSRAVAVAKIKIKINNRFKPTTAWKEL